MYVCVCVRERERETENKTETANCQQSDRGGGGGGGDEDLRDTRSVFFLLVPQVAKEATVPPRRSAQPHTPTSFKSPQPTDLQNKHIYEDNF